MEKLLGTENRIKSSEIENSNFNAEKNDYVFVNSTKQCHPHIPIGVEEMNSKV